MASSTDPWCCAISARPRQANAAARLSVQGAATARRKANSHRDVASIEELADIIETSGGYVYTGWSGDPAVEERVKDETKATLRCIPGEEFQSGEAPSKCIGGDGDATMEVVWARAY